MLLLFKELTGLVEDAGLEGLVEVYLGALKAFFQHQVLELLVFFQEKLGAILVATKVLAHN